MAAALLTSLLLRRTSRLFLVAAVVAIASVYSLPSIATQGWTARLSRWVSSYITGWFTSTKAVIVVKGLNDVCK